MLPKTTGRPGRAGYSGGKSQERRSTRGSRKGKHRRKTPVSKGAQVGDEITTVKQRGETPQRRKEMQQQRNRAVHGLKKTGNVPHGRKPTDGRN